jgi:hypothetical protein
VAQTHRVVRVRETHPLVEPVDESLLIPRVPTAENGVSPRPLRAGGAEWVWVDQTAGATYGLTTMLTSMPLNLNDVTSLWLCPKVANGFVTEPCPAQMVL